MFLQSLDRELLALRGYRIALRVPALRLGGLSPDRNRGHGLLVALMARDQLPPFGGAIEESTDEGADDEKPDHGDDRQEKGDRDQATLARAEGSHGRKAFETSAVMSNGGDAPGFAWVSGLAARGFMNMGEARNAATRSVSLFLNPTMRRVCPFHSRR